MGLFSKLGKNKQDAAGQDSGYYSRDDTAAVERARSKRASSADGEARPRGRASREDNDPVLPEKKRARRRLVGAIALALLVAVGLPMLLDSEPKPLSTDIDIRIPSKDKAPEPAAQSAASTAAAPVAASAALDGGEEIVAEPSKLSKPVPAPKAAVVVAAPPAVAELKLPAEPLKPKDIVKPEPKVAKVEHKPDPKPEAKADIKPEAKAEAKLAEAKPVAVKPAAKDDGAQSSDDAARALAILEGKPVKPAEAAQKIVYQVAALATQDKADELLAKLKGAGIKSFTHKSASDELIRVRIGPFASKEEAAQAHAKLAKLGLSGNPV
ncbi:SPOR domain-containing protein [Rugamonas sp.]|uniref:SPOR domain-containing protein n=1 Tax=Rugamonas sp. TaxID=1926287 RepID=UPI0025ED508E|nr:SPOR domain-containing protein [Rugamonas sp.]